MVDRTNLQRVSTLYEEFRTLDFALDNFDNGGVIISMTVSGGPQDTFPPMGQPGGFMPRTPVTVSTWGMQYPEQMVTGIRSQFEARKTAIAQELTSLGVTGELTTRVAPQPAAPAPRPGAR